MSLPGIDAAEIERTRREADLLYSRDQIDAAVRAMAVEITSRLGQSNPLLLVTMTGGLVPAALLLPHLDFPLQLDYVHVTRYGNEVSGGRIEWIRRPPATLKDRTVLLIDDLLDRGLTLAAAVDECRVMGARDVLTAVLVVKQVPARPGLARTDFHALVTPDRYLFGYGMDYRSWWRNGPGIFAVKGM